MRRLPIFFLLDVSESMVGLPLNAIEEGMERIVSSLRQDPSALETAYVSVIAFAGKVKVISPLTDIVSFYPPKLPIGGGTSLGLGLETLMNEIDKKVILQSQSRQRDWKPLVFLITDGKPTDNTKRSIQKWKSDYSNKATMVAITLGENADISILKQLTPHVLIYEGSSNDDFKKFFDWISASVQSHSQAIEQNRENKGINLSKKSDLLKKAPDRVSKVDESTVVLVGRCQSNKAPYLVKYEQVVTEKILQKYVKNSNFTLNGCYPITEEYFKWSSENSFNEINISELEGVPSCSYCGNISAIASCGYCQKIMCIDGEGTAICPWCKKENNFVLGDADFNIQRGEG
jgi:uncharacterized protein YegL